MWKLGWKKTLAGTVAGLALTAGGGAALAASEGDSSSSFLDAVARHLGISSQELADAAKAAAVEQVDAALEEGEITEEQAAELKARIESGEGARLFGHGPRGFPGFGGPGFHGHAQGIGGDLSAAADFLGLEVDALRERLAGGESLADVAEAEGKPVDGLKEALAASLRERLDEAVEGGRLTREQADAFLERMEERIGDLVEGALRGRGGPHGGWRPFESLDTSSPGAPAPEARTL